MKRFTLCMNVLLVLLIINEVHILFRTNILKQACAETKSMLQSDLVN